MVIYNGLDAVGLEPRPRVLAVGAFDGVHRGHQRLLGHVCRTGAEYGIESAIMTFEPIPAQVFRQRGADGMRLTVRDERERELARQCVDIAVVTDFNQEFRDLRAEDFAREILVRRLGVVALVASKTHTFGRNAEADVQRIAELGMELGFEVHVLPPILVDGQRINSTDLRNRLWAGDVEGAADWLGRPYDMAGEVVSGRGVGRQLGFPTANLQPHAEKLIPADGVYACAARVEGEPGQEAVWRPAAVSIGHTPTLGDGGRLVEAHFLESPEAELAGATVRVLFLRHLRDQERFADTGALSAQIARDVQTTREVYALDAPTFCGLGCPVEGQE